MASNRPREHRQGAPLKPPLHAQVSSLHGQTQPRPPPKTPVSRRLTPDPSVSGPSSSSSSLSTAVFRPKLAADPSFSSSASSATPLRPPPITTTTTTTAAATTSPSTTEEADKSLLGSNVTPRSSSRKSRVDSNHSTPQEPDDTPSHAKKRPHMTSPTTSEPASRRTQVADRPNPAKARSIVASSRPILGRNAPSTATSTSTPTSTSTSTSSSTATTRPTVRGYVNTKDSAARRAVKSPTPALGSHLSAPPRPTPRVAATTPVHRPTSRNTNRETKSSSPMFFRANETPSQPASQEKALPSKKSPAFFYANGQHEEHSVRPPSHKSSSPVLSAVSDNRSPHLMIHSPSSSEPPHASPLLSPPLSAVSGISGLSSRSPYFPSPGLNSPSVAPSTSPPKGNIHLSYRKGASQIIGIGALPLVPTQRKTSLSSVRSAHNKSNSLSSIDSGSPALPRRQSQPISQLALPLATDGAADSPTPTPPVLAPPLPTINTNFDPVPEPDIVQSPTKPGTDIHAEARRERKVLDLEISNSSLLAINKSLEREIRKQKAELKRYRRLSRAGQFAVPDKHSPSDDMSTVEEENDLPAFDDDDEHGARPSSPFLEQPAEDDSDDDDDDDDDDSTVSSTDPSSPSAQADKDAARRTEDENHLRLDLSRHRELLLDTQRMNQSLQRCLFQTEGLIKDGKKALEYQVTSSDVKLGGHILSPDDFDDNSSQIGYPESVNGQQPDSQYDTPEPDRCSVGSEMDSGIDFGKRGPLTISRSNPHYAQPP